MGNEHNIIAVEINPEIATIYKDLYPDDEVIIADAHQYLLDHYKEHDFIWSSPVCTSHSRMRYYVGVRAKNYNAIYPDFSLYEEIVHLKYNSKSLWAVENVVSYYKVLIEPKINLGRHPIWSNFPINSLETKTENLRSRNKISDVQELHNIDLSKYKIGNKRQLLRNCVNSEIGLHILKSMENSLLEKN